MKKTIFVHVALALAILLSSGCSLIGKGAGPSSELKVGPVNPAALWTPVPGAPAVVIKNEIAPATAAKVTSASLSSSQTTTSATNCSGVYLDKWAILYDDLNQRWSNRAVTMLDGERLRSITPANPTDEQKLEATFWVLMASKFFSKIPGEVNRISGYCLPLPKDSKDTVNWAVITYWALAEPSNPQLLTYLRLNGVSIDTINNDPWIVRTRKVINQQWIQRYVPRISEIAKGG